MMYLLGGRGCVIRHLSSLAVNWRLSLEWEMAENGRQPGNNVFYFQLFPPSFEASNLKFDVDGDGTDEAPDGRIRQMSDVLHGERRPHLGHLGRRL